MRPGSPRAALLLVVALVIACAARPLPGARVGSAEATVRAAVLEGADGAPEAVPHLRLAREQIDRARALIADGEPERAEWLLVRAEADAALAAALAREARTEASANEAAGRARAAARGSSGEESEER